MSPRRINQITALLLLLGFGGALVIYLRASPVFVDPLIGNPLHSKKHMHELRLMGGHANVALAEFQAWFASLWEGEQLGVTVAVLTVLAVPVFRFIARHPDSSIPTVAINLFPALPTNRTSWISAGHRHNEERVRALGRARRLLSR